VDERDTFPQDGTCSQKTARSRVIRTLSCFTRDCAELAAFVYCTPLEQIIGCCGPADDCVGQDRADVNGSPSERQHLRCTLMHSASLHKAPRNNRQVHPKPQRDDIITGMNCFVFCFVSPFDSTI